MLGEVECVFITLTNQALVLNPYNIVVALAHKHPINVGRATEVYYLQGYLSLLRCDILYMNNGIDNR